MKCTQVLTQLDDYVDGHLEATEALQVRLHIDGCSDCGGEERSLRRLLAEAAALPVVVEPRRDLWPGIADRISPKNVRRLGPGWVDRCRPWMATTSSNRRHSSSSPRS